MLGRKATRYNQKSRVVRKDLSKEVASGLRLQDEKSSPLGGAEAEGLEVQGEGSCRQTDSMSLSPETGQHLLSVRTERGQQLKSAEGMG